MKKYLINLLSTIMIVALAGIFFFQTKNIFSDKNEITSQEIAHILQINYWDVFIPKKYASGFKFGYHIKTWDNKTIDLDYEEAPPMAAVKYVGKTSRFYFQNIRGEKQILFRLCGSIGEIDFKKYIPNYSSFSPIIPDGKTIEPGQIFLKFTSDGAMSYGQKLRKGEYGLCYYIKPYSEKK